MLLSELAPLVNAQQGAIYQVETVEDKPSLRLLADLCPSPQPARPHPARRGTGRPMRRGEAAHPAYGRAARLYANRVEPGRMRHPQNIVVLPALFEGETKAVIELASLRAFPATHLTFLEQLTQSHRRGAEHHRSDDAHRRPA